MPYRLLAVLAVVVATSSPAPSAEPVRVIADFSAPVDYPLSKSKFGVFNSGMVRPDRYDRDAALFGQVHPESVRVDLGWGARWIGWKTPAIFGSGDSPQYDFAEMDRTAIALRSQGVPAYWSYCYTPRPVQPKPGDYRGMPTDLRAYGRIIHDVAAHYRDLPGGDPVGYHEIGNEPDNRDFFTGTRDDYLKLYEVGSRAVREANPDAVVGGPALAFDPSWVDPFLDRAVAKKLPLDFFSFHYYPGIPFQPADLPGRVRLMERALDGRPSLRTTQLHLNEFNSYRIDYPKGGRPVTVDFQTKHQSLNRPTITRIDADHGSWGDDPSREIAVAEPVTGDPARFAIELPADGVVMIRYPVNGVLKLPAVPAGRVVRDWFDYPTRTGTAYLDVDRRWWTVRMGSGLERHANCTAGFTAEGLPDKLSIETSVDGGPHPGLPKMLAIRVDLRSPSGRVRSIVCGGATIGTGSLPRGLDLSVPWESDRPIDQRVTVPNLERFELDLKSLAPPDWAGRADFSFLMRDAGPGQRMVFAVRR
jgi:hypothetical protein